MKVGKPHNPTTKTKIKYTNDNEEGQKYFFNSDIEFQQLQKLTKEARSLVNRLKHSNEYQYEVIFNDIKYSEHTLQQVLEYLKTNSSAFQQIIPILEQRLKNSAERVSSNTHDITLFQEALYSLDKINNVKFDTSLFNMLPSLGYKSVPSGHGSHINKFICKNREGTPQFLNFQPDKEGNFKSYQLEQLKKQIIQVIEQKQTESEHHKEEKISGKNNIASAIKTIPKSKSITITNTSTQTDTSKNGLMATPNAELINNKTISTDSQELQTVCPPIAENIVVKKQNDELPVNNSQIPESTENITLNVQCHSIKSIDELYHFIMTNTHLTEDELYSLEQLIKQVSKDNPHGYVLLADLYCAGKLCKEKEDHIKKTIVVLKLAGNLGFYLAFQRLYDLYQVLENSANKNMIYAYIQEKACAPKKTDSFSKIILSLFKYQKGEKLAAQKDIQNFIQDFMINNVIPNQLITIFSFIFKNHWGNKFLEMSILEYCHDVSNDTPIEYKSLEYKSLEYNRSRLSELQHHIGYDELKNNQIESGIKLLKASAKWGNAGSAAQLGDFFRKNNSKQEAIYWYRRSLEILKIKPDTDNTVLSSVLSDLAKIYYKDDCNQAIDLLIEATKLKNHEALLNLMKFYSLNNKYFKIINEKFFNIKTNLELAINCLDKMVQQENYHAAISLSFIYAGYLRDAHEAKPILVKALKLVAQAQAQKDISGKVDLAHSYTIIGECYRHCELFKEAGEAYEMTIKEVETKKLVYPDLTSVINNYTMCLKSRQLKHDDIYPTLVTELNKSEARSLSLAIIKLNYLLKLDDPKTIQKQDCHHSALASCYRDQGKLEKAKYHAEEALRLRNIRYSNSKTAANNELLNNITTKLNSINSLINNSNP